jgi:superfamily II DNA or RNA helicase
MPLHPKAKEFAKSGLFAGLSSFEELEKRIAAIPENKGKGDAFEVFAEAYLATQRKHDAHQVWPLNATPLDLLGKLGLGGMDYGVDGVLQTLLGDLSAYQVKFRTGREPMTWRELSTFMGLADSPHIRSRILITNCDELPTVINDRQGFFCIRGSDLDRMEVSDFQAIEAWLAEAAIQAPKKKPLPHQEEALAAIVPTLQKESRATAIMACGTGKTLVTLWTAEQLSARKILVLLPSLALLRQTLHEWLKETSMDNLAYLCVCSDPTVKGDADEISTPQSDLDFEVSTNSEVVRRFLDAPFDGTKIVFSTYQSASVVGEAMKPEESFDLGIFDEAHKTAGREGRNYGYALDDSKIRIEKRLFVTATPRHYNPSKQTKEGEATIAFSMDDPKVYGPQCFTLTFSKAANLGIICGYKVIISVITSDQVNNELLSKGLVHVQGDEVLAQQVANQIALRDAVAQYGVSKIFTFHSTVKAAASFVAHGSEGVGSHLPEFDALYVSGAMPTAHREKLMQEFRRIDRGVMSNARCLTEGVDVPAVDMVAFLSPKKSKVDIVQAIGRAMRRSGSKDVGYILIPLYLEQKAGESLEEAVARANFEEVWDILQSLKEQDEVLADLIREMAEAKGRGKGENKNPLGDRIDYVGPVLSLESLRESITAHSLERLESSWDVNFGKLQTFKQEHGHCRVSQLSKTDGLLGRWVSTQRVLHLKGILLAERVTKLESLGFEWDPIANDWEKLFNALRVHKQQHRDCDVSLKQNQSLRNWIAKQRAHYSKGTLSKEKVLRLESLGIEWDKLESNFEESFRDLMAFKTTYGHCRVPVKSEDYLDLGYFVLSKRRQYLLGKLSPDRIARLESIGFEWAPNASDWEKMFEDLKTYKHNHGDCRVPISYSFNKPLANWVSKQRKSYSEGKLSPDYITRLEELGFEWDLIAALWEDQFNELVKFRQEHGHCRVPKRSLTYSKLGGWIINQRQKYLKGYLQPTYISRLDALGIEWKPFSDEWERRFHDLEIYKKEYGNCNVPTTFRQRKLAQWVSRQRKNYASGEITPEHKTRLEQLGFNWRPYSEKWDTKILALKSYKQKHGHCLVINRHHELGPWVNWLRQQFSKGKLSKEQISNLEDLGFEWDPLSAKWEIMFNRLIQYKKEYGNCRVVRELEEYKDLGVWVAMHRQAYKKNKIPRERISRLEEIGFEWDIYQSDWEDYFSQLVEYQTKYGHCRVPSGWKDNKSLASWVLTQREYFSNGEMLSERINRLEKMGFEWYPRDSDWKRFYEELKIYMSTHGHCRVPDTYSPNPSLGKWVANQRTRRKKGRMSSEQIALLDEIGFFWGR